ncbi:amidohydrolase [Rhizobium sp. Leaf384]|uniref:amidohydrolase family protein n=1 Tax=unclassified Rhizobium TaxID=2613769 RepID=UPI0007125E52|nr:MULTISPECIES: amidohydrolase family protein [unclassified Rhizobium]KQS81011.1 amidohydrolase [Rhizobium sp. Leaf384]KQS86865.1 amidohydrolase [Rhizobium sp. Leaf383]
MTIDFVIRNARLQGREGLDDIAFTGGVITGIAASATRAFVCDAPERDAMSNLLCRGLVETHLHLDKAGIIGRCNLCTGTLAEAVAETARAKAAFTEADVYERAAHVVCQAIVNGTNRIRTFVEIDGRAGFRSFEAIRQLRIDYRALIDIEICAFVQEGLTNDPGTLEMLETALQSGADLVGGCPYTDPDPQAHIAAIFDLADRHGVPVDFHLDFDLDPQQGDLPTVITETVRRGHQGRVSIGHVTKLSALPPDRFAMTAREIADAGIAVTVLPATDLFLTGRNATHLVPRGVAPAHRLASHGVLTTLSTNNVLNPFTPFGDMSLLRMANLYANIAQLGTDQALADVFDMITRNAERLLGVNAAVPKVGDPATLVLLSAPSGASAIAGPATAIAGWKNGRQTFDRPPPRLFRDALS